MSAFLISKIAIVFRPLPSGFRKKFVEEEVGTIQIICHGIYDSGETLSAEGGCC